jgi:hypothetical protein
MRATVKATELAIRSSQLRKTSSISTTLIAFLCYAGLSILYFGLPLLHNFTSAYIGVGNDPTDIYMWSFSWWPYAISHRINPFISTYVWAPTGLNLAWVTSLMFPSIVLWPVTAAFGPVATYNALMLLGPTLGAICTYLLVHRITKNWWASLCAGYLYGFSSFEIAQTLGHTFLTFNFYVPLSLYVVYRFVIEPKRFKIVPAAAVLYGIVLACQFMTSIEVFATYTVFLVLGFVVALIFMYKSWKKLFFIGLNLVAGYIVGGIISSPLIFYLLHSRPFTGVPNPPSVYSTDLLNLIIPTPVTALGTYFTKLTSLFTGNSSEQDAYFGIPLILTLAFACGALWSRKWIRALAVSLLCIVICSFGPVLHITTIQIGPYLSLRGKTVFAMPWYFATKLPLLKDALPSRFTIYAFLASAIILAAYIASLKNKTAKILLPILCLIPLIPSHVSLSNTNQVKSCYLNSPLGNLSPVTTGVIGQSSSKASSNPFWCTRIFVPSFFTTTSDYKKCISPGATVMAFPYGPNGASDLYQAYTGFYFKLADGYLTPYIPLPWQHYLGAALLYSGNTNPNLQGIETVIKLMKVQHVAYVLIPEGYSPKNQLMPLTPQFITEILQHKYPSLNNQISLKTVCNVGNIQTIKVSYI